ncbi:PTS system lichenan oligosaccharide-specific IIA component, Lac family [Pelagirhabdus alkalitolerans]|uniref:PTS system lichenan oligosaccharide-specific IIA component, Lac family n=1 Tax=Pelagirhabdus alkalitolerans TaxID=1612202 RepID=A0A1G6KKS6_9BACI|nr:PTS lactose/cellobiose transporter subunit IIA [Pelagirhabdus alkalitolerans]SDC31431.1 PTS system lichenan oligosaccharide-specific IIA component, Lac family [Pelagirhabdus alkalitolerans]
MENQEVVMGIIMHGGNARSAAMKAMSEAKKGNEKETHDFIEQANEELNQAHRVQTDLIQAETRGEKTDISLLMVHAQDHLMNAMTVRDLALEVIHLNEKINQLEGEN